MEKLKGKAVKVVYKDGQEVRSIKGFLLNIDDGFIEIQAHQNSIFINKSQVLKVVELDSDSYEDRPKSFE